MFDALLRGDEARYAVSCTEIDGMEFGGSNTSSGNSIGTHRGDVIDDVAMSLRECQGKCLQISECVGYTYANGKCDGKSSGSLISNTLTQEDGYKASASAS